MHRLTTLGCPDCLDSIVEYNRHWALCGDQQQCTHPIYISPEFYCGLPGDHTVTHDSLLVYEEIYHQCSPYFIWLIAGSILMPFCWRATWHSIVDLTKQF